MLFRRALACLLANLLIWNQPAYAAPAAGPSDPLSRFDQVAVAQGVVELRALVNRGALETDSLLDTLDWDEAEAIRFVREEVQFEQYPGMLRGARGTLWSRAGNALDQAALLAALLKSVGLDARIAATTLPLEDARRLLEQMPAERAAEPAVTTDLERLKEVAGRLKNPDLIEVLESPAASDSEIAVVERAARLLEETLAAPGEGSAERLERLAEEARDY